MATLKEYKDCIIEQLDLLDNITCKAYQEKIVSCREDGKNEYK